MMRAVLRRLGFADRWVRLAVRQRTSRYWFTKQRLAQIRFEVARRFFTAKTVGRAGGSAISTAYQILRSIAVSAVFAGLAVVVLAAISAYASRTLSAWKLTAIAAQFLSREADANGQVSLYSTTAQIAGIFLGLYFTALSVVASTSYKDVPAGIREVVTEERAGSVYLKVVAFSGRVMEAAEASTPKGYRWSDPSFQNHQQRIAAGAVTSLSHLVPITSRAANSTDALAALASRALATLLGYSGLKPQIPSESHWFERVMQHPSWLTASSAAGPASLRRSGCSFAALVQKIEREMAKHSE